MSAPNDLTLSADSLFYKSGFYDGDVLFDWAWDWAEADGSRPPDSWFKNHHDALCQLVRVHLLPLVPGEFTVYEVETIHNPIRIETWRGKEWDDHTVDAPAGMEEISVNIPAAVVTAALEMVGRS